MTHPCSSKNGRTSSIVTDFHDLDIASESLEKVADGSRVPAGVNPLPTLLRNCPYRFFFYSNEGDPREVPHVHVTAVDRVAKFWLEPLELASSKRLRSSEIADLRSVVERHRTEFVEAWHAYFDT